MNIIKKLSIALFLLMIFLLQSCAISSQETYTPKADPNIPDKTEEEKNIFISAESPIVLDPDSKLGTRKNPVPIGEPFEISATENGKTVSKLIISVAGVTRG